MTQIDELSIRVPGLTEDQGSRLGNDVAQIVAQHLPDGLGDHRLPEIKIKMNAAQMNAGGNMASAIADQIIRQIKMAVYNI